MQWGRMSRCGSWRWRGVRESGVFAEVLVDDDDDIEETDVRDAIAAAVCTPVVAEVVLKRPDEGVRPESDAKQAEAAVVAHEAGQCNFNPENNAVGVNPLAIGLLIRGILFRHRTELVRPTARRLELELGSARGPLRHQRVRMASQVPGA